MIRARRPGVATTALTTAALAAGLVGAGALLVGWWRRNATGGIFGTPIPPDADGAGQSANDQKGRPS